MLNNKEKLLEIVDRIMSEMFFLFPDIDDNGQQVNEGSPSDDSIQVSIQFNYEGSLLLKADRELLSKMASNFMGILPDRIEEEHLRSMAVETANIIGGNYLSEIDPESEYDFYIPEITESEIDISSADWQVNFVSSGRVMAIIYLNTA